jgi:hypothetical protein
MIRRILLAGAIGVLATAAMLALSFVTDTFGFPLLSRGLLWQNSLLQALVPLANIGTTDHPIYEGSPLNLLAFVASIPLGIIVYGVVAYIVLFMVSSRNHRSRQHA